MHRLTSKPAFWIALISTVAVAIVSVLFVVGVRNGREGLSTRFDGRAQLASQFTSEYLRQVADRERRVASTDLQGTVDARSFASAVTSQDFTASLLLDADGKVLQVYPPSAQLLGSEYASRYTHLEAALEGRVAVSDIVPSAVRAEPIVAVAVPFDAPDGRRIFSSGFRISQTPLDAFVRNSVSTPGARAFLVDGSGVVIASTDIDAIGMPLARTAPDLEGAPTSGHEHLELDGEASYAAAAPIDGTDWHVLVTVPTASLYRPLNATTFVGAGAVALFIVLLVFGVLLALRLIRTERDLASRVAQLEAANRTLDTFSHTLVHDLRNPLTAIGGLASTLHRTLDEADERAREMTAHIESSAERMHHLIEDVLALATATRSTDRQPLEPRMVLDQVAADMPGLELQIGWLPQQIAADRSSLTRAFQNLLGNACAYARDEDGATVVTVTGDENPWQWTFTFEDHGPGIAEEDRERLFTAFERGRGERPGSGTGLGLSIVAACAHAHGGSIRVQDASTGGARFVLTIAKSGETAGAGQAPDGALTSS